MDYVLLAQELRDHPERSDAILQKMLSDPKPFGEFLMAAAELGAFWALQGQSAALEKVLGEQLNEQQLKDRVQ